jgi:putative ABC transport system ATP-binding protein
VNRELGTTTAIITHNVAQAEIAERIVHLRNGLITSIERNAQRKYARELTW